MCLCVLSQTVKYLVLYIAWFSGGASVPQMWCIGHIPSLPREYTTLCICVHIYASVRSAYRKHNPPVRPPSSLSDLGRNRPIELIANNHNFPPRMVLLARLRNAHAARDVCVRVLGECASRRGARDATTELYGNRHARVYLLSHYIRGGPARACTARAHASTTDTDAAEFKMH